MNNLTLTCVCSLILGITTSIATAITISNNPNSSSGQYTDLQLAIDTAIIGNTILVSGSTTNYNTGDVLIVRHPFKWYKPVRYLNASVRFFTKCYYNHTAIIVRSQDKIYVAEVLSKGISITPFEEWEKDLKYLVYRPMFSFDEKEVSKNRINKPGYTGYDFSGTLFYQLIYQVTNVWIGKKGKKSQKRLYCSEYVAWIYEQQFPEYWKIAPVDIYVRTDLFDEIYNNERQWTKKQYPIPSNLPQLIKNF